MSKVLWVLSLPDTCIHLLCFALHDTFSLIITAQQRWTCNRLVPLLWHFWCMCDWTAEIYI